MTDDETQNVPRKPEEPTPEMVADEMEPCEPYTVTDLQEKFDDVSRWTIERRLKSLHEEGVVNKKKHTENRVSYWIEP